MSARISKAAAPSPVQSLPAWLYTHPGFFALERERVFRRSWQIVCHVNDIPRAGDYQAFDFLDEKVLTLRGDDGAVCAAPSTTSAATPRLRASADGTSGNAAAAGWSAPTTPGRLRPGRPAGRCPRAGRASTNWTCPSTGLVPVEQEDLARASSSSGFPGGGPSVAAMMSPYAAEIDAYAFEDAAAARQGGAAAPPGELEEHRRQLRRRPAHPGGPSGPLAPVRRGSPTPMVRGSTPGSDKMSGVITPRRRQR